MSDAQANFRAGVVAVVGRPNVGKSTLVNALVGQKVSITAPKPQTTRHRILGIVSREGVQVVLVDTPGLHSAAGKAINRYLNRTARGALGEADVVLLVIEAGRWKDEDEQAWIVARDSGRPVVLAVNKIDKLAQRDALLPFLAQTAQDRAFAALVPVSALKRDGADELIASLRTLLPVGEPAFDTDAVTDRSSRFLATELIREQVVRQLHQELPFACTVQLDEWKEERGALWLSASIFVERDAQTAIVIGAGGARIKAIGTAARKSLVHELGMKVHLSLWCKVREDWSDDQAALAQFGYGER
jgi:GTP-binding protein Era